MPHGKTIELFFVTGAADGLVTAELSNWNAQAIRIPREDVYHSTREDIVSVLDGVGVYFLVCKGENRARDSVYVGESESLRERLRQHLRDHDAGRENFYWNFAVAFVGGRLDKALIRYLENKLVGALKSCDKCLCLTQNTFQNPRLKPAQIAAMDEFLENIETLMSALGLSFMIPIPSGTDDTVYYWCKSGCASAMGFRSPDGFTVVKDSRVSDHVAPRFDQTARAYSRLRKELEEDGTIRAGVFTKNHEFSAPSAASSVVLGHNSSGNKEWKQENGITLGQATALSTTTPQEQ